MVVSELTDKGCIIWLYIITMLLIILLSILKEKDFNSIPLLSVS
jgi:N6-adenosine-specific RNA methylase IME4